MADFALVTAFGEDRPGIVATLAEALFEQGCNIEDTCMTRLRGAFTMMVMVRLPAGVSVAALADRLGPSMEGAGLTAFVRPLPPAAAERTAPADTDEPIYMLSVYGADHPGIVAKVARLVADHAGNVTDMNTRVIGTAEQPVYVMVLEISLPPTSRPEALAEALERAKPSLGVDLTFRRLESVQL